MALCLIVEERKGSTQISVRLSGHDDATPFGSPQPFTPPLSIANSDDLRFYIEDYAKLPVGEYSVRGERVEREQLSAWGEALFASIFGDDEKRREAYVQAKLAADRGEAVEVAIRTNNPRFLALLWELMKAPGERNPISVHAGPFDRSFLITDPASSPAARTASGFDVHREALDVKVAKEVSRPYHAVHFVRHGSFGDLTFLEKPSVRST